MNRVFSIRRFLVAGAMAAGLSVTAATPAMAQGSAPQAPSAASAAGTGQGNWLVYHGDVGGSGNGGSRLDLSSPTSAWTSPALDGQLYGEPLVFGSEVLVATENDTVYGLSATNGSVLWQNHLGPPVPSGNLPCGDISPSVGITSTPVIDRSRKEIFVVADINYGGTPIHELYGLDTTTGTVELQQNVDPSGEYTPATLQRASLTLAGGNIVFGYGGNAGDCSTYHGWVVSVPETGGPLKTYEVDSGSGEDQGAIWMGGAAPVVDKNGNVWAASGNGSVHSSSGPFDYGNSVLELSPSMQLLQYFAPSNWYQLSAEDADVGSVSPVVLPDGSVVQGGKGQTLYLLKASDLGGIGGNVSMLSGVCGNVIDGGTAYDRGIVYLPCTSGVLAVRVRAGKSTMSELWQSSSGAGGPPILAGGSVWTISGGTLYGLDPATGAAVHQLSIGTNATHFPTPSVGDGLLLAPGGNQVFAFSG